MTIVVIKIPNAESDYRAAEIVESDWAMAELERTDNLVKLPDYPHMDILIAYRAGLRKYDLSGDRPAAPTTPKGTLI